jgi:anaerobic selenocysteine-containing dehydrogenase
MILMSNDGGSVSRRGLFQRVAAAAGGMAILLGTNLPAVAKMTQKAAGYQEEPKGDQSCSNCGLFSAPASCSLVDGTINPQGWCRFHQNKS